MATARRARAWKQRFRNAHFLGTKRGEELARLYASADVFVFPSLTDTFGIVLLEALACGVPVAAYPVQGPIDIIGDSGAGVLSNDLRAACLAALDIPRDAARDAFVALHMARERGTVFGQCDRRTRMPRVRRRNLSWARRPCAEAV